MAGRLAALAAVAAILAPAAPAAARSPVVQDGPARFEVLSPTLIRMQYAPDGRFENRPTLTVVDRRHRVPRFVTRVRAGVRVIRTGALELRHRTGSGPFSAANLELVLLDGRRRTVLRPDPARTPERPLGGWRRSLDLVQGPVPLHPGVLSRAGWHVLDDTATVLLHDAPPGFAQRPAREGAYQDLYLFGYGRDLPAALADLRRITGPAPLPPRKAFGVWFSRWWPYGDADLRALVARFRAERVPLDTLSLDTDFKSVHDPAGAQIASAVVGAPGGRYSWNGWGWNAQMFPDPGGFVRWAHAQGIELGLNVHPSISSAAPEYPATEARAGEPLAADEGCRIVQADPRGECRVFDWTRPDQLDAYFALHEPFERDGIDFWWLDWCCDASRAEAPGLTADTWINHRYTQRQRARGERWAAFSRIGGSFQAGFGASGGVGALAEHRVAIQFTGDTCGSWPLIAFAAEYTAAAAAIGMPFVSHDIGSFHGVSPLGICDRTVSPYLSASLNEIPGDMYARWVQLGAFQPFERLHSHHGLRLPWEHPGKPGAVAADFLRLRASLVPLLYTLAREGHARGLPMARALWLRWPQLDEAHRHPSQFLLGRDVLVAPVSAPGDPAPAQVWLPQGGWTDWFTGERLRGPRTLSLSVPLERMPVYVRDGAIVVTQPYAPTTPAAPPRALELTAYPGSGAFTLYEDAGDGLEHERGARGFQRVRQRRASGRVTVTIGRLTGRFAGRPARRTYELRILGMGRRPRAVTVAGRPARSWSWDGSRLTVRLAAVPTVRAVRIVAR
ncbi:MAG TPA: TIM-barrel domain-containing protein [Baekduia sp.]|nr:TIM-barrel domain-containing protein [Baekduia sp.]